MQQFKMFIWTFLLWSSLVCVDTKFYLLLASRGARKWCFEGHFSSSSLTYGDLVSTDATAA